MRGEVAAQEREARPGELRRRREVEHAEALAEVDVIAGREVERPRLAPAAHLDVVVGATSVRRRRVREVRQVEQEVAQIGLDLVERGLEALDLVAEARDLGEDRRGVLALRLGAADLLRERVAALLQLLRADLDVLAAGFERLEALGVEGHAALGEAGGDAGKIVAEQIDVEH